jgi:O-antigen/teichoic acid export membrane protein
MKLTLTTSAIGLALNPLLIPKFGILGLLVTNIISGIPSLGIALWWIKKKFNATINWVSSAKILLASTLATVITYMVTSPLSISSWVTLIIGAVIFLATYLVTTPLIGAINKKDVQNFREMLKGLGPLAPIFTLPLSLLERLTEIFQRS